MFFMFLANILFGAIVSRITTLISFGDASVLMYGKPIVLFPINYASYEFCEFIYFSFPS